MPEGRKTLNVQTFSEFPKIEDLPKLTKKQLAEYIYNLYIDINIVDPKNGVGKDEWVRRMLNGAGAAKPAKKDELVRQLGSILDDRENDLNLIESLMQGDELLLSSVMLAHRFSRNVLETELDARDDTAIPDERNATLSGFSTEELSDIVKNYRAYRRPEALQMVQAMTNFYDSRNNINYRAFVEQIIENEYENRPSYMEGLVYHRIHSFFARQRDEGLEDLDERQYKALYQAHLDGSSILEDLGQEYNANFTGGITADEDVQRLIEQYTYTFYSDVLIDRNEPTQKENLKVYVDTPFLRETLYGIVYNWKGLKEENSVYTAAQLSAEDPNFNPELEIQDGAFAANKTYIAYKLTGANTEETVANVKAFLMGGKNDTFDGAEIPEGWYWETVNENLFTGEENPTTKQLISYLGISDNDLRMKENISLPIANQEVQTQRQNIKFLLGKYNADELQKFISKELEENALKSEQAEKQFIEFLASFRSSRYSARNQLMLYIQAYLNEYVPIFGTFDEWKEKGTSIQQGMHGLTICRPIFSDVYYEIREEDGKQIKDRHVKFALSKEEIDRLEDGVKQGTVIKETELTSFVYTDSAFSMSQTKMTEDQRIEYLQRYNALNTSTENAALYDKLKEISLAIGRPVEEQAISSEALGWVERSDEGKIVIKADMPVDSKVSVLTHEIGHKLLHIQNATAENRAQKEVQAQLFSHLAMLKLGIDAEKQFSLSYINNWIKASDKYPPVFDADGRELSKGEVLQLNLLSVIPAVDALMKTVGEKEQPIDKEALQALRDYNVEQKQTPQKKIEKQNKVEIEPLRVIKETEKAAMVKLPGASPEDTKKYTWLPKSQISINKDGFVYEATPNLIKDKGLTPKAALTAAKAKIIPQRSIKI